MVHMQIISKFPESSHYTIFIQKHLKVNPVDSLEVFLCLSPSLFYTACSSALQNPDEAFLTT